MITVTGIIQDATGTAIHATIDFISRSTPLAGTNGVITTNTDDRILSNPSDGTFSVLLQPGNYTVTIAAQGQSSQFNIAVPTGDATMTIDTLVTTPLVYPFVVPNTVWNGRWAGNITFLPADQPADPSFIEVTFAGGNIDAGANHYSYWISYQTSTGETQVSPALTVAYTSGTNHPNKATRIFLNTNPPGATNVRIWRTYVDTGSNYNIATFPVNVGLLATVAPAADHYDDWESTAQFLARVDTTITPPLFNTTAGQLLSSNGTVCAFITDAGLYFPGANCRIKPGVGLQIYNFTTKLWYTLLNVGNPAQWSMDSGNPN